MKKLLLPLCVLWLYCLHPAHAQHYAKKSNFELDFGLGYLDLLHVGMKYELIPQSKIGMSYGSLFATKNNQRRIHAIALEHEYHFGQKLLKTSRPLLYFSQKLTYLTDTDETYDLSALFVTPSIGKRFYSDGPFGINIDAGLMFRIFQERSSFLTDERSQQPNYPAVFPAIRFQFFFQI